MPTTAVGGFKSANGAPARRNSSNLTAASRDVIKRIAITVWEAIFNLHFENFVDNLVTVNRRVSICNITKMRTAPAAQLLFHAC